MAFVGLFGEKLLTKEGEHDTTAVLKGKSQIMVFFSARWSPTSRQYTKALSEAYEKAAKESDKTAIIFVSSDRDQKAFDEYWASISFHALPYSARDLKNALSTKYAVKDIPALVLLDGEGNLKEGDIFGKHDEFLFDARPGEASNAETPTAELDGLFTEDSANEVAPTPSLHLSPSASAAFVELFGGKLMTQEGEQDTTKVLAGNAGVLAIFAAQWSPACRESMSCLSTGYQRAQAKGSKRVVIYVSLDRNQTAFDEFWGPLSFSAVPFAARDVRKHLCETFGIKVAPSYAVFDGEGRLVKVSTSVNKEKDPKQDPREALTCQGAAQACNECSIS